MARFDCRESRSLIASAYVRCLVMNVVDVEKWSLRGEAWGRNMETWRSEEGSSRRLAIGALS